jgi:hypothetical protein
MNVRPFGGHSSETLPHPININNIIIIISIHEFRPGWPVSVSAVNINNSNSYLTKLLGAESILES